MTFNPDPLTLALGREYLNASSARHDTVQRMNPRASATNAAAIQGSAAGDSFNKSLDLDVLDKPSGKVPEPADVEPWQQPLAATKAGIHGSELLRKGSGMVSNSPVEGTGKINPVDPFEYTQPLAMRKGQP